MTSSRRGIPIILYIVTALATLGITIGFAGLIHSHMLFFGSHLISLTSFIIAALLSISLGSLISAWLVGKSLRPMLLFIIFQATSGFLFLFQPTALQIIKVLFHDILSKSVPGHFGIEILRFSLTLVLLFFPLSLFAGSFPLLVRHFIKHVSQSGRYMNASLLSGSTGILAALLALPYLILPFFGYKAVHIVAALFLITTALMAYLFSYGNLSKTIKISILPKTEPFEKTTLRFRKKKPVLEMGVKLTRAMLKVFYLQGFAIASLVFLTFRISALNCCQLQSHTLIINGMIIMAGIITGGLIYKRVSEKPVNKYMTLATLQITTGFVLVLSYILMRILSASQQNETFLMHPESAGSLPGMILLSASLLFFPALLYGLALPLAGKLYPKRLQQVATAFGRLGASFSFSAVFGILVTIYILTPLFGIQLTYLLFAFITLLSGIYLIFMDSRLIRLFRLSYAIAAVFLFLALAVSFRLTEKSQPTLSTIRTIEGKSATFSAISDTNGAVKVLLNGKYYYGTDSSSSKAQKLSAYLPLFVNPKIDAALVIGFGTGITASIFESWGVEDVIIADKYPEVIRLSADVFADINNDIFTNTRVRISSEDAGSFLEHTERNFDLIVTPFDLFVRMPGIYTTGFYRMCAKKLSDHGVLCQVLPASEKSKSVLKSCVTVFPVVSLWYVSPDYLILFAGKDQQKTDLCTFSEAFSRPNARLILNSVDIPDLETLLAHALMTDSQIRKFTGDIPENIDYNPFSKDITAESDAFAKMQQDIFNSGIDYQNLFSNWNICAQDSGAFNKRIKNITRQLLQPDEPPSDLKP
ncbi:MAG: fused MFS/spermidine synthase [Bacteroidales bacterium]|nr:fused MFS/spermidine synthase [Bacteroidales bacterium]